MGQNTPHMTAAMLATLAATATTVKLDDQRRLLEELTAQVEEQKRILRQQKEGGRFYLFVMNV